MNRNLKQSLWVLTLGIAFTGLSAPSRAAALPAQQAQDQDRIQNPDRTDNQKGEPSYFRQGVQDGQHDRQFGSNRTDHPQPTDANDLRAYRDGYKQGIRNSTSGPKAPGRVRRIWWTRRA
jgi:hypothetical protein